MHSWADIIQENLKDNIENLVSQTIGVEKFEKCDKDEKCEILHDKFKLPIEYLPKEELHELLPTVSDDLELVESEGEVSMYDQLFQPSNILGKNMITNWKKSFTSNEEYLKDSQLIILESNFTEEHSDFFVDKNIQDNEFIGIWDELKMEHSYFLEKYCYVEWEMLESFNRSSTFLQMLSVINMMSPVLSLLLPFIFLLVPFIILKLRNIPITFSVYFEVLKEIAKSHFIGRTLHNITNISMKNLIYLIGGTFMFFYQIYQNIVSCQHFYANIKKISKHLLLLKEYLGHSIRNMKIFVNKHSNKKSMTPFIEETTKHIFILEDAYSKLESHNKDNFSIFDSGNVGYLLKNYYEFHSNKKYERSIRYAFGFDGYLNNIKGVQDHIQKGNISIININTNKSCYFKNQFYPVHVKNDVCIKNNCDLSKKNIITGPNASGKTTFLKTTTINIIFSQQIGAGFFEKGSNINPYTHIHSYLNIPDTSQRDSLFQAESRRCKEIINIIHENNSGRHFGIFDELYSGTNPDEATKSGYAFLKYLSKYKNVDFILTTHYNKICTRLLKNKNIQNYKMNVVEDKIGDLTYTYKIKKGISNIQGAIKILEQMDYPDEILEDVRNFNNKKKKVEKEEIKDVSI